MTEDHLDAFCGLYCGACEILRAERDGGRERAASMFGCTPGDVQCGGCRTDRLFVNCRGCEIRVCAALRGFEFCGECPEFPCAIYRGFAELGDRFPPHYRIVIRNQKEIGEKGAGEWRRLQLERWSCPSCGAPFPWYAEKCGRCGGDLAGRADWRNLREADLGIFAGTAGEPGEESRKPLLEGTSLDEH